MGRAHDPDSWGCVRISESPLFIFSIREDGTLLRTRKSDLRETKAKVSFKKGKAFVYIGRLAYKLDSLIAMHFIKGYQPNDLLEHIDVEPPCHTPQRLRQKDLPQQAVQAGHGGRRYLSQHRSLCPRSVCGRGHSPEVSQRHTDG